MRLRKFPDDIKFFRILRIETDWIVPEKSYREGLHSTAAVKLSTDPHKIKIKKKNISELHTQVHKVSTTTNTGNTSCSFFE